MSDQANAARAASRSIADGIKAYILATVATLSARIEEVREEVRRTVSVDDVRAEIAKSEKRLAAIANRRQVPSDDAVLSASRHVLDAAIARYELELDRRVVGMIDKTLATLPAPRDGKDGAHGRDGAPGKDGAQVEDFEVEALEGGRYIAMSIVVGGQTYTRKTQTAMMIDRGIHSADQEYEAGDVVTHSGSAWVASQCTRDRPGQSPHWRLMVKRGRDGKDSTSLSVGA